MSQFDGKWQSVKIGDSKTTVHSVLGPPDVASGFPPMSFGMEMEEWEFWNRDGKTYKCKFATSAPTTLAAMSFASPRLAAKEVETR